MRKNLLPALLAGVALGVFVFEADAATWEMKVSASPFSFDVYATVDAANNITGLTGWFLGDGPAAQAVSLATAGNPSWNYDNALYPTSTPVVTNGGFLGGLPDGNFFNVYSTAPATYFVSTYVNGLYNPGAAVTSLTLTAVPEPSTWAMMLAGFIALGFAGYRRARSPAQM